MTLPDLSRTTISTRRSCGNRRWVWRAAACRITSTCWKTWNSTIFRGTASTTFQIFPRGPAPAGSAAEEVVPGRRGDSVGAGIGHFRRRADRSQSATRLTGFQFERSMPMRRDRILISNFEHPATRGLTADNVDCCCEGLRIRPQYAMGLYRTTAGS